MNRIFTTRVHELDSQAISQHLRGIKRGFEKECLRVDEKGFLSETPHPIALGSSLTHPLITTDYSEALLEFITLPTEILDEPFKTLDDLHRFTTQTIGDELLWTSSMPCFLPSDEEIPIAHYGTSNLGQLKHIYRRGLGYRYGRRMQTIAGIHYNFSLPDTFWEVYQTLEPSSKESSLPFSTYVSEQYLNLIRNCLRSGWILPYLFGSSPAVCASFFKDKQTDLEPFGSGTFIGKYATSLRLSDLGYNNKVQSRVKISYDSLDAFIKTMKESVYTSVPEYQKIGVYKDGEYRQLSDCIFQIEDEHYAMIRPKRVSGQGERMLAAILEGGIEYIELRSLDINPFVPMGVAPETVHFLDTFLLTCLLLDSPSLTDAENQRIRYNHNQIVKWGRKLGLSLQYENSQTCSVKDWGRKIIDQMLPVAAILDKAYGLTVFTKACEDAQEKFKNGETLASNRMLQEMTARHKSYFDFAWHWSKLHQKQYRTESIEPSKLKYFQKLAAESIQSQTELERSDEISFKEYLARFLEL